MTSAEELHTANDEDDGRMPVLIRFLADRGAASCIFCKCFEILPQVFNWFFYGPEATEE